MSVLDVAPIRAEALRKMDSGEEMHPSQVLTLLDALDMVGQGCNQSTDAFYAMLGEFDALKKEMRRRREIAVRIRDKLLAHSDSAVWVLAEALNLACDEVDDPHAEFLAAESARKELL